MVVLVVGLLMIVWVVRRLTGARMVGMLTAVRVVLLVSIPTTTSSMSTLGSVTIPSSAVICRPTSHLGLRRWRLAVLDLLMLMLIVETTPLSPTSAACATSATICMSASLSRPNICLYGGRCILKISRLRFLVIF